MDRTALHEWWRPSTELCAMAVALVVAMLAAGLLWEAFLWAVTGEWALLSPRKTEPGRVERHVITLLFAVVLLPLPFLVVRAVSQRPWGTVLSVLGRMRWRWLAVCVGPAVGHLVLNHAGALAVTALFTDEPLLPDWEPWERIWKELLVVLAATALMVLVMEFFRGWALQAVGAHTLRRADGSYRNTFTRALGGVLRTPWPAIAAGALPTLLVFPGLGKWETVGLFLGGCACGWLAVRTGGLEAAIALQMVGAMAGYGLTVLAGEYGREQSAMAWYALLAPLPAWVFFAATVLWLSRRMNIATVTPG